jgi:hypothetical protein
MKIGNLVTTTYGTCSGIGVLLEEAHMTDEGLEWLVHWLDDGDWTWEPEKDLKVIR